MTRSMVAGLLLFLACAAQAAQVTVDFDELAPTFPLTFESDGFFFEGTGFPFIVAGESQGVVVGSGTPYFMSEVNGSAFDLLSIDIGACASCLSSGMLLTGHFIDGGVISRSISTVQKTDNLETFSFSPDWVGLERLEFVSPGVGVLMDNIVVNVVPIPAAVWLFGSALAGLVVWRRRPGG